MSRRLEHLERYHESRHRLLKVAGLLNVPGKVAWRCAGWLAGALVACSRKETVAAPEASDAAPSPCVVASARDAASVGDAQLGALVSGCTGLDIDVQQRPQRADLTGAQAIRFSLKDGSRLLILVESSPAKLTAWAQEPASGLFPEGKARFESLGGETVLVESATDAIAGLGGVSKRSEIVWLRRGTRLRSAGHYEVGTELRVGGDPPSQPLRTFDGRTMFHGNRIELREDVTWGWYDVRYTDILGFEATLTDSVRTTYETGYTLTGDTLIPDAPTTETTPARPHDAGRR